MRTFWLPFAVYLVAANAHPAHTIDYLGLISGLVLLADFEWGRR